MFDFSIVTGEVSFKGETPMGFGGGVGGGGQTLNVGCWPGNSSGGVVGKKEYGNKSGR